MPLKHVREAATKTIWNKRQAQTQSRRGGSSQPWLKRTQEAQDTPKMIVCNAKPGLVNAGQDWSRPVKAACCLRGFLRGGSQRRVPPAHQKHHSRVHNGGQPWQNEHLHGHLSLQRKPTCLHMRRHMCAERTWPSPRPRPDSMSTRENSSFDQWKIAFKTYCREEMEELHYFSLTWQP